MTGTSFMDDYRAGRVTAADIDDYVGKWHTTPDDRVPLAQYLGLTWNEFRRWGERSELPRFLDHSKACGAPDGSRWGYLPCGCSNDGYGGHVR